MRQGSRAVRARAQRVPVPIKGMFESQWCVKGMELMILLASSWHVAGAKSLFGKADKVL